MKHPAVQKSEQVLPRSVGLDAYRNSGMGATIVRSYSEGGLPEEEVMASIGPWSEKRGLRSEPGFRNPLSYPSSLGSTLLVGGAMAYLLSRAVRGGIPTSFSDVPSAFIPIASAGLMAWALSPSEYTV